MKNLIQAFDIPYDDSLYSYSNPIQAQINAFDYLGDDTILFKSTRKDKKYMVLNPNTNKFVHFGCMKPPMEDFLKHQNNNRQEKYLARATGINKGNWLDDLYNPNHLSIMILWSEKLNI